LDYHRFVGDRTAPLLEIVDVSVFESPESDVSAGIVAPSPGTRADSYALEVLGWLASKEGAVEKLRLAQDGRPLWRVPTSRNHDHLVPAAVGELGRGFAAALSTLSLPPRFELEVNALPEGGPPVPVATIEGRRAELQTGISSRIRPLMINTFGRTGSRLFLQLLESHPRVVAYMAPQYEPKAASYWVAVLRSLSEPKSYLSQIQSPFRRREWWLGPEEPRLWRMPDEAMQGWMGREAVEDLARLCQSRIDAFYEQAAERTARSEATYFAEKFTASTAPSLVWELYPDAREVILVRDFRDMTASILAFNERKGRQMFGRDRVETDEEFVARLGTYANSLVREWQRRSDRAHLLRYEDLIRNPDDSVRRVLEYLELETSKTTLDAMTSSLSRELKGHRTAASRAESVERWRNDLSDGLQEACRDTFGPALAAFGYALES
jgi:hypothetical protein